MNKFRHALCVILVATTCALRAADKDKDDDENPLGDFMPTSDDLVQYVPKLSLKLGFRALGGVHAKFSTNKAGIDPGLLMKDSTTPNINRTYNDGYVYADTSATVDPAGNSNPQSPPGTTNTWSYANTLQRTNSGDNGSTVAMHDYVTALDPVANLRQDSATSLGVEVTGERDMGAIFHTRLHWGVIAGFSVNQISAINALYRPGTLTTTTDVYVVGQSSLPYGSTGVPDGPYTSSSATSDPVLISNVPLPRGPATTEKVDIYTRWRLHGAYLTFRAGPTLTVPITSKFSASLSAGATLTYVGTTYDVEQQFVPLTGDTMQSVVSDGASGVLPGFYADATLQYTMTENSGVYLGGVVQAASTFKQEIKSSDGVSDFTAKVDFGNMEGVKAGFLFKF